MKKHQNNKRKNQNSQSGQASLEMALLLLVALMITLGLVYRFNTAFKKYTVDMYGTYYRCLLETGELPGVGSVCKDRQARFDIANGRELVKSGGVSGDGTSSGKDGKGTDGKGGTGAGSGKQAAGGSSGSSGSSESVGSGNQSSGGGRGSVIGRLRGLQKQRSTAVGTLPAAEAATQNDSTFAISAIGRSRFVGDSLRRERTKTDFKIDGSEYTRADNAGVTATTAKVSKTKKGDRADSLRPRAAVENQQRAPAARLENNNGGGLEFGKLFRLFLIIAIIIAIIIFIGGQVLQISKSGEQ